jgi:hypothetical protein
MRNSPSVGCPRIEQAQHSREENPAMPPTALSSIVVSIVLKNLKFEEM